MKISTLSLLGTLLIAGNLSVAAKPKTESPVKIDESLVNQKPYRYTGLVLTELYRGSGFCAWNNNAFFSAAHVVFGEGVWDVPPVWVSRQHDQSPNLKRAVRSRGYYRWREYADLATATNSNPDVSVEFGKDVILAFAFENLITGKAAMINTNGSEDLKKKRPSLITGYPAENNYRDDSISGYYMHQTGPMIRQFSKYAGKAMSASLVTTGGGNSGGPIWTKNKTGAWIAAGVLVGGRPSESVVYAFSKDVDSLTRAVAPVLKPKMGQPVVANGVTGSSLFFPINQEKKIPEGSHKWTSFRIGVDKFGSAATVKSIKLSLDIRTEHRGDLVVVLDGPLGYQALLHNEQGAGKKNLVLNSRDLTSKFAGIPADGYWYLRVQDRLKGDPATFKSAVLEIEGEETATTTP